MTFAPLKAGIRTPYGEARSTGTVVTTNTQRYIGAYQETANLHKLGARYYDTTTGRFTQTEARELCNRLLHICIRPTVYGAVH